MGLLFPGCARDVRLRPARERVKVVYDKSVDLSKYKTYSWAEFSRPSSRPLDLEQKKKSLDLVEKAIVKLLKQFPPRASSSK